MLPSVRERKTKQSIQNTALGVVLTALMLLSAAAASATTLEWTSLSPAWDDTDTSGSQNFLNVGGSGVDVTVSYTDNMFDRNSVPNIYTPPFSPSPEIVGTLRFTNDRDTLLQTSITIRFSRDVLLSDLGTVSLSTIGGSQENIVVEAFDSNGASVLATTYGSNTPDLVDLDLDGDGRYQSRGLGSQRAGLYGDTFYSYIETAVREVRFSLFTTDVGGDEIVRGYSSQGIRNIEFSSASVPVPEPSTAMLIGLGLLSLGSSARARFSR